MGRYEEAAEVLRRAALIGPDLVLARYNLGLFTRAKGFHGCVGNIIRTLVANRIEQDYADMLQN